MNYKKIYQQLVERCVKRQELPEVYEKHHIIPRCMGGGDETTNLVEFTPREHFIAHRLLSKIYPDNLALKQAVILMTGVLYKDCKVFMKSRKYHNIKTDFSRAKKAHHKPEGVGDMSMIMKIPMKVSGVSRGLRREMKISKANSRLFSLIVCNLMAVGSFSYSKSSVKSNVVMMQGTRRIEIPSVYNIWVVAEKMQEFGYIEIIAPPADVPRPLRKRSYIKITEKLFDIYKEYESVCGDNYQESLEEVIFRDTDTKKTYTALPFPP